MRLVVGEMVSYPQSTVLEAGGLFGTSTGPNCKVLLYDFSVQFSKCPFRVTSKSLEKTLSHRAL